MRDRLRRAKAAGARTESERVLALPRRDYTGLDLTEELRAPGGTMRLHPIQSAALAAIRECDGALLPIGVGQGKSLIGLLAGTVLDARAVVLLTPASTVSQLRRTYATMHQHWRLPPRVVVIGYELLSRPQGTDLLDRELAGVPEDQILIVADEAHSLKAPTSSRTKRVERYLAEHPDIRFVAMSGTLTAKSLKDFAHLGDWSLRDKAPVPRDPGTLNAWSACIDVGGRPTDSDWRYATGLWQASYSDPLASVVGARRQAMLREAFQSRLRTSPGVVASAADSLGCSLQIYERRITTPDDVEEVLRRIDEGIDFAGDPIPDDVTAWRLARHASQGFAYFWDWPGGVVDREWLDARSEWHRMVRWELAERSDRGYDSPFLIASKLERDLAAGRGGSALHRVWQDWKAVKDRPAPPVGTIWISDYLVRDAIDWARRHSPTVIWYDNLAVAAKLRELGVHVVDAGEPVPLGGQHKVVALSIASHGVGVDGMQYHWHRQIFLAFPSGGKTAEQVLGRLHRLGQPADTVEAHVYTHTPPLARALETAIEDAVYIDTTLGTAQKLLYADRAVSSAA